VDHDREPADVPAKRSARRQVKFVRHLLAASIAVGLVVVVGFIWKGTSAASLVSEGRSDRQESVSSRPLGDGPSFGTSQNQREIGFGRRLGGGISASNLDDLVQTLLELGLIIGAVIVLDVLRRQRRRRQLALPTH
jgi:hypothetical protein